VAEVTAADYLVLRPEGFPEVVCYNDKRLRPGDPVHLSVRPEKFRIQRERPAAQPLHNCLPGVVEDVIYLGDRTKYRVRIEDTFITVYRQHNRFLLDERPITFRETVWITWHADDGYILAQYRAADEELLPLPAESTGELTPNLPADAATAKAEG